MNTNNIQDIYPLSPMQQGMLFHSIYSPESGTYIEQIYCDFVGPLNVEAFQRAWQAIIKRNPILRTAFVWEGVDEPVQVVFDHVDFEITQQDWRMKSRKQQAAKLRRFLAAERKKGFELSQAPLMRIALFQTTQTTTKFVWTHHHLLLDGWSQPLLIQEFFSLYEACDKGRPIDFPERPPFRHYIEWLQEQDMAKAESFWRQQLKGFSAPTPLVVDRLKYGTEPNGKYTTTGIMLSKEESERLSDFTKESGLTLNTLVQGVWAMILSRYSGEPDVLFGATASGRPPELAGADQMVGLFINTLPVRTYLDPDMSILDWLKKLQAEQADSRRFEYSSLAQIKSWSDIAGDETLFNSILVFENYPVDEALGKQEKAVSLQNLKFFSRTNFPLTFVCSPGAQMGFEVAYDCDAFAADTIHRLLGHVRVILQQFVSAPNAPIKDIDILTEAEKATFSRWNQTYFPYKEDTPIHRLFEQAAANCHDQLAVYANGDTITYQELNERANQLAHYLRRFGVTTESIVGVCLEKSVNMIVAILGVMKAGGAYVPIDPHYPVERISYLIEDSGLQVLITWQENLKNVPDITGKIVCIDAEWPEIEKEKNENPNLPILADNLAYMIYTSGSTGNPKGTLLQHRGLCSYVAVAKETFGLSCNTRVLQSVSFSFDVSVSDFFKALSTGSTLYLVPPDMLLDSDRLVSFIREHDTNIALSLPSILRSLEKYDLSEIKTLMTGGEACSWEMIEHWLPGRKMYQGYGPTETTIAATWTELNGRIPGAEIPPIGKPLGNLRTFILDENYHCVPIGVVGQLYVAGIGLARGYHNRPDLTAEKFIPNPFAKNPGERLYATGDLVKFLPSGQIVFQGRVDHQIKIRGFRVELGEIQALVDSIKDVKESLVVAREDVENQQRIVAYVILKEGGTFDPAPFNDILREKLPGYMLPASYVQLEDFPLTPNGKIDRKALPIPDQVEDEQSITTLTPTQELVAGLYQDLLHIEHVSSKANFFALGGHSLLATQLLSRLRDAFEIDIPMQVVFESATLAELSAHIDRLLSAHSGLDVAPIIRVNREEELPLSFAQQRLWFLDQLEPDSAFNNIPIALRLLGELNVAALGKSLNALVERHQVLRTSFTDIEGKPVQNIAESLTIPLQVEDIDAETIVEQEKLIAEQAAVETQTPFNLTEAPLFRARLLRVAPDDHVIFFTMHHIISDGWSISILVQEIAELYRAFVTDETPQLPPLPVQYVDFAEWQRRTLQGENLEKQLNYWQEKLAGNPGMLELPTDFPRPRVQSFHGDTLGRVLSPELSRATIAFSRQEGVTLFMTLFAAFATLLYRYSNQDDFNIGTPIANRNRSETEGLIGFFVNNLVLRCRFDERPTFLELLQQVRRTALEGYAHQDIPFEMLVERLQPERDLSHSPLFQVVFVMQNTPMSGLELPGLSMAPVDSENKTAKFDLSLQAAESPDGISLEFEYNTDLFKPETIERMLQHIELLLQNMLMEPDQRVDDIKIIPENEEYRLLHEWNANDIEFPTDKCAHEVFEAHVLTHPDAVAAIYNEQQLTYSELNARANQLARHLRGQGIEPDQLVGISLQRSLDQAVAVLGVLKAGAAFVPIDPTYPEDRIAYMLEDSGISILLSQSEIKKHLPQHGATVFCLDTDWEQCAAFAETNLDLNILSSNLAYVIYTSGSTGKPKGTMLQHQGAINLAQAQKTAFNIHPDKRILQFAPMSFDASVWETVMALLNGAALVFTDQENLTTGDGLLTVLRDQKITTVTLPPSVLAVVPKTDLPDLHTIITAGEKCPAELVERWRHGRHYFNAYGPTETTVCASMFLCDGRFPQGPPIGRPIDNAKLYILDAHFNPTPIGVAGELCVGGPSLARGYLNRPDLSAEKFIPNPFDPVGGSRLYRTGDLVRYLPDGNIEFLGRIDHQVKVRGFRIELGEIEAVLSEHPSVQNVIVLAKEIRQDDTRLVAYCVFETTEKPTVDDLRLYMKNRLPDYMVPATFVYLDEMPLTPSGKIDRKALPAPDLSRPDLQVEYVAPRNETEEKLVEICQELLRVDKVGVNDNFFDLGGHSLLATQFMSRMRTQFHVELPLRVLFEQPTVAGLAEAVEHAKLTAPKEDIPAITAVSRESRRRKLADIQTD
ncbi:amino acid adenylation domain-containing protein [candidate division KSB1 bacterium]|nr:amino acid adenylation domain-containing protein [candidate division KSB1 bacterium]RQW04810.1 MAG: amino acid adenylation domain-containing protein [candidate division KSB1 bacterium]